MKKHHSLPSMNRFWVHRHRNVHGVHAGIWLKPAALSETVGLNIHLPFCQRKGDECFCQALEPRIDNFETTYASYLHREWLSYLNAMPFVPKVAHIHLGAGYPLCFSVKGLGLLLTSVLESVELADPVMGHCIEAAPGVVSGEHLGLLSEFGFRQLNMVIFCQDYFDDSGELNELVLARAARLARAAKGLGFTNLHLEYVGDAQLVLQGQFQKLRRALASLQPNAEQYCEDLGGILTAEKMEHSPSWWQFKSHRIVIGIGVGAMSSLGSSLFLNEQELAGYFKSVAQKGFGFSEVPNFSAILGRSLNA